MSETAWNYKLEREKRSEAKTHNRNADSFECHQVHLSYKRFENVSQNGKNVWIRRRDAELWEFYESNKSKLGNNGTVLNVSVDEKPGKKQDKYSLYGFNTIVCVPEQKNKRT